MNVSLRFQSPQWLMWGSSYDFSFYLFIHNLFISFWCLTLFQLYCRSRYVYPYLFGYFCQHFVRLISRVTGCFRSLMSRKQSDIKWWEKNESRGNDCYQSSENFAQPWDRIGDFKISCATMLSWATELSVKMCIIPKMKSSVKRNISETIFVFGDLFKMFLMFMCHRISLLRTPMAGSYVILRSFSAVCIFDLLKLK